MHILSIMTNRCLAPLCSDANSNHPVESECDEDSAIMQQLLLDLSQRLTKITKLLICNMGQKYICLWRFSFQNVMKIYTMQILLLVSTQIDKEKERNTQEHCAHAGTHMVLYCIYFKTTGEISLHNSLLQFLPYMLIIIHDLFILPA